ncbi:MAG: N-formylglutamate amidohydrolase [Fibrobacter sp.]|uniref:N-formylglutamate amidohydrolase n=1 Tax=Fibrobacter sp. TaxID=35828 RepID=UPI0025C4642D|nr:N-formylglutamate amidohydrolase [Fibrobacter sp.]MBR4784246.1 N-formylglutamate amidohydrolase [Fibrobacter sp.]
MKLMLTCEHASNRLPAAFKKFVPADVQQTHRAYDIGALMLFRKLVKFAKPEFYSEGKFSRLFVDLNRTITNKSVFSEYYGALEDRDKTAKSSVNTAAKMKAQATAYWKEYRENVEKFVASSLSSPKRTATKQKHAAGKKGAEEADIVHLGIHSFTPVLNGNVRNTDIGILYDPSRPLERTYANVIKDEIKRLYPHMKVRFNYPYKGSSDGLTTALRKKFGPRYVGIEIEINQKFFI